VSGQCAYAIRQPYAAKLQKTTH